ncbi:MAG: hypothetical protein JSS49_05290 [Planctomycetes bacterium]|nr:hypothetical protein [Planctomycetota bacterium]
MPREKDSNASRRADLTLDQLKQWSEIIFGLKKDLDGLMAAMREYKLKSVWVDGVKKIPVGVNTIKHGLKNIDMGIAAAKRERA